MPTSRLQPPHDITALAAWLQTREAGVPDIKPGNAKGIVWAGAAGRRSPWAVVYLHGFSASRLETAPLAETVAAQLGANLFHTRLTGHGRLDPQAMGEASLEDWKADTLEALQMGQTLGERVLVMGSSTGGTLATWLGSTAEAARVSAFVFLSPNFGLKDRRANIVNLPWGQKIALLLHGPTLSSPPANEQEAQAWTTTYPTKSVFPMMALLKSVRDSDLSRFQTPVLVLYSERDAIVDPAATLAAFARLGSTLKTLVSVDYSRSKGQHVLAGSIKDPAAVAPMAHTIVQWVKSLPQGAKSSNG